MNIDEERRAARRAEFQRELSLCARHDSDCAGDGQCTCDVQESLAKAGAPFPDMSDEEWTDVMRYLRRIRRTMRLQRGLDPGDVH